METQVKVKNYREKMCISQAELAEKINLSQSAVALHEKGQRDIPWHVAKKYAQFFNIPVSAIYGEESELIPLLGSVPAGGMLEAIQNPDPVMIVFPTGGKKSIVAFQVQGDSMNLLAPEGSIIAVDKSQCDPALLHGHPIIAQNGDEVTFKIWDNNLKLLMPRSTNPHHLATKPYMDMVIYGKVVAMLVSFEKSPKTI